MIKREMQKRILTPRYSSLAFFYFRFFEIRKRILKHYFAKAIRLNKKKKDHRQREQVWTSFSDFLINR